MANDLDLLKAAEKFAPLPIAASRTVKLGGTVATVGCPDIGLHGFAPKVLAHGHRELPENVNYEVKSRLLLSFLESVPEVAAKLKEPKSLQTATPPFEDMVKSAQDAAVLVLVY